jgi:hypothetical protein
MTQRVIAQSISAPLVWRSWSRLAKCLTCRRCSARSPSIRCAKRSASVGRFIGVCFRLGCRRRCRMGPHHKAAVVQLTHHHMLPLSRTGELMGDLFGLLMSDATVLAIQAEAQVRLAADRGRDGRGAHRGHGRPC